MAKISRSTREELVRATRERYALSPQREKSRILDEFVKLTGFHRKHAIRVLNNMKCSPSWCELSAPASTTRSFMKR